MKLISFVIILLFISLIGCVTNDKTAIHKPVKPIDKTSISEIKLLIADTSILNLPSVQLTPMIEIGDGSCFVDSNGIPLHQPTQTISFKNTQKDSLIDLFNEFLKLDKSMEPTNCIILYTHVFILLDNQKNITEQIDFAFECPPRIDYLHRGTVIEPDEESVIYKKHFDSFIGILRSANAFIPIYGPPPPPAYREPPSFKQDDTTN